MECIFKRYAEDVAEKTRSEDGRIDYILPQFVRYFNLPAIHVP
jgi:hypothetical protein